MKINEIESIMAGALTIFHSYMPYNPMHSSFKYTDGDTPRITLDGYAVYKLKDNSYTQIVAKSDIIKTYCPSFTYEMMYEAEKFCGYEYKFTPAPMFECYIDYTFNTDGSFSATLSEGKSYNNVDYSVVGFTYVHYFDKNYITEDGRIFLPSEYIG